MFLICMVSIYNAQAFELSGKWVSPSGQVINIYPTNDEYIAYNIVEYTDQNHRLTGDVIHYYWLFNKSDKQHEFTGTLNTVDTYWQCELENGEFKVQVLNQDKILVLYPSITFAREDRYRSKWQKKRVPIYCNYNSRWESFDYICGWHWERVKVQESYLGSTCNIKSRNTTPIELDRLK